VKTPREVLEARARALAKPLVLRDEASEADALPILQFHVADQKYAVPVESVVALVNVALITPLPRATDPVFGAMAWRGRPLAVLTLGTRPSTDAANRVIVLGTGVRATAGLLVDDLDDIRVVGRSSLAPSSSQRAALSLGVTTDAVLVLDADALIGTVRTAP
jgi:chemotaxis signal transduction protein